MKTTKIDWCDSTLNPVVGCPRGCTYCYANKLNDRFHFVKDFKCPEFFPERLEQLKSKKPKSIFMDSMSDIAFWDKEFEFKTYNAILKNQQHKYIFLTKSPNYMLPYYIYQKQFNANCFLGLTITNNNQLNVDKGQKFSFYSIEPILEKLIFTPAVDFQPNLQQLIIGAETGNRKGKIIPQKEWIDSIIKQCDENGIRVFMKKSLRKIMGEDFRQDKLIWEIEK